LPAEPGFYRIEANGVVILDFPFKLETTNVVHMTVKPTDFGDDEADAGGKGGKGNSIRGRDDGERGAGCRCVIL